MSLTVKCVIINYNYFTGELREFDFTEGFPRSIFCLQNIQSAASIVLQTKLVEGCQSKVKFNFPKKSVYRILSSFEMKLGEFVHENFAERVVNLLNCPKGRKVTLPSSQVGNVSQKAVKNYKTKTNELFFLFQAYLHGNVR